MTDSLVKVAAPKPTVKSRSRRKANATLVDAILSSLRPRCARCKKPVKRFWWSKAMDSDSLVFRVECHGQALESAVAIKDMADLVLGGVQGVEVFGEPKQSGDESGEEPGT